MQKWHMNGVYNKFGLWIFSMFWGDKLWGRFCTIWGDDFNFIL